MNGKKVCIIGAGLGGLSAAINLLKTGYNVTIFEKENIIGGRSLGLNCNNLTLKDYRKILSKNNMAIAFSEPPINEIFEKEMLNGYKIDLGFHSIEGGNSSDVGILTEEAGYKIEMVGTRLGLVKKTGYKFPLFTFWDKLSILPNVIRLFFSGEKKMKSLDKVSINEAIKIYGKGKTKMLLELLARVVSTVNDLNKISTGETLRANQLNVKRGKTPVGYPIGGLGEVNNSLIKGIKNMGGEIRLNEEVKEIITKNKKAIGVKTKNKTYDFDIIVYNGLVQNLFDIIDEKYFSGKYVKYLKSLSGTGSLCAYYSLKKVDSDLLGKSFLFIKRNAGVEGNDAVGMIEFVTAVPEAKVAPISACLVQSYVICSPAEAKSNKYLPKLKEILDKNLNSLVKDYAKQLNWAIYPTVWHLDGVAKTIDNNKADIKTQIKNLYLIGDCTKAPGVGMNCAVNSAKILIDLLENN